MRNSIVKSFPFMDYYHDGKDILLIGNRIVENEEIEKMITFIKVNFNLQEFHLKFKSLNFDLHSSVLNGLSIINLENYVLGTKAENTTETLKNIHLVFEV